MRKGKLNYEGQQPYADVPSLLDFDVRVVYYIWEEKERMSL